MTQSQHTPVAALAGNPNVGKSTLFNALTGLNQHTGNWPGKTVSLARGSIETGQGRLTLVDLPGTYSLRSRSREERVTEDFLRSGEADCVVVVCDGSCLERNLILVQQILQLQSRAVVCVNLMDEAERCRMSVDCGKLSALLGVPVVPAAAGRGQGLRELTDAVCGVLTGDLPCTPIRMAGDAGPEAYAARARALTACSTEGQDSAYRSRQARADRLLAGSVWGLAAVGLLLLGVVWLTVAGANGPSRLLQALFDRLLLLLHRGGNALNLPTWITGPLLDGMASTCCRVIAVMLPPMAIFFPLFTLLEDVGYLPRAAFLLDRGLSRCGACGKQALTMCMGLGCNAVGVMGCRIIDSPRQRLTAMVTNSFLPCNGRFPTLILLSGIFFGNHGITAALTVTALVLLGAAGSMGVTALLNRSGSRAEQGRLLLELPPYRRPRLGQILVRSLLDRTLFVAGRAVTVAAPAGLLLWLCSNAMVGGQSLLRVLADLLEPAGAFLGMNGPILLAFLFALPANELMMPVLLLILTGGAGDTAQALLLAGWSWKTALCTMVFSVFHWPCSTTLITIYKESGKLRPAVLAGILPTAVGVILCILLRLLLQTG